MMMEIYMKAHSVAHVPTTRIWGYGESHGQHNSRFSSLDCPPRHEAPSTRSSFDSETTGTSSDQSQYNYSTDEVEEDLVSSLDDPYDNEVNEIAVDDHSTLEFVHDHHPRDANLPNAPISVGNPEFINVAHHHGSVNYCFGCSNAKESASSSTSQLRRLNQKLQRVLTPTKGQIRPIDHNTSIAARPRRALVLCKVQDEGHNQLVSNLQLGLRYSIEKVALEPKRPISLADLGPKSGRLRANFPLALAGRSSGSSEAACNQITSHPNNACHFKWKDYCPMVFRSLREMFKIDSQSYLHSLCGTEAGGTPRQISSPGKSGSVFYLSRDERFLIKTVRKAEAKVLLGMLHNYYEHVKMYPNTLLTKFAGLHEIKLASGRKVRLVVMAYLFPTDGIHIHRKFDLKGSSQGRSTNVSGKLVTNEHVTLKDLDLDFVFHMDPHRRDTLLRAKLVEHHLTHLFIGKGDIVENDKFADNGMDMNNIKCDQNNRVINEVVDAHLGIHMQARAKHKLSPKVQELDKDSNHECGNDSYNVVLYCGIIDILQRYNMGKRLEHAYKSIHFDPLSISAIDPSHYSKRFRDFISVTFLCS